MNYLDFILFLLYFIILYRLIKFRLKYISNPVLKIYFKRSFFIRVISCFAFSIFLLYISPGDSYGTYYMEALSIYKQSLKDPSIIQQMIFTKAYNINPTLFDQDAGGAAVFLNENNYMPARIAAIFMFFSFGKYLITNLFFSMLAFEGCWRLYKFFYDQFPTLHKQLAYSILYFPTFIFWSSGISKEALCVAGIGFITYGLYAIFVKKSNILSNIVLVLLFTYLLFQVKIYILLSYLPFFIYYLVVTNVLKFKNQLLKIIIGPIIVILSLSAFVATIFSNEDQLGVYAAESLTEGINRQQTNFQLQENISESNFNLGGEYDGTVLGLLKIGPLSIVATLFRPFIWEARKVSTLLSSVESLLLLLFTIYVLFKVRPWQFIKIIYKKPIVAYTFLFSIIFSVFVGASTLNFGSLVRYKIPCLPFYTVSMFLILHFCKLQKEKSKSAKQSM